MNLSRLLAPFVGVAAVAGIIAAQAAGQPVAFVSDTVHAPNTGTACSGQANVSGIPRRSLVDRLPDPWRADTTQSGASIVTVGELTPTTPPENPILMSFAGSPVTASASKQDVSEAEAASSAPNSVGVSGTPTTTSPLVAFSATLQDCAPRPQSLFPGTGGGSPGFWNSFGFGDASFQNTRQGVLFTFSRPLRSFGAWFGDLETRTDGEGTPARLKLLDVDGVVLVNRVIDSDYRLEPGAEADSPPDRIAIDQGLCGGSAQGTDYHLGCGNQGTRWIGFSAQRAEVAQMLIVVGDDDSAAQGTDHLGLLEHLSWIGPTLAENAGELTIEKRAQQRTVSPGDPVSYSLLVGNPGDRAVNDVQVVDILPPGIGSVVASDGGVVGADRVTWPTLALPARSERELTVQGIVLPSASGQSTNVAVAGSPDLGVVSDGSSVTLEVQSPGGPPVAPPSAAPPAPPPVPAPPAADPAPEAGSAPVVARRARLAITKRGPARVLGGNSGLYRITVRNRSSVPARNVIVADMLPRGVALAQETAPGELRRARNADRVVRRRASGSERGQAPARAVRAASIRLARARANQRARLGFSRGLATWRIPVLQPGASRTVTLRVSFGAGARPRTARNSALARADNAAPVVSRSRTQVAVRSRPTRPRVTG